jgi:tyrosyl-tRNA synthetase
MVQSGGVRVNKIKVGSVDEIVYDSALIKSKFLIVQKGARNYFLIVAE